MPTLPPPGSDPTAIAEYVDRVVYEAANDQRRLDWVDELLAGYRMHLGDHFDTATADVVQVVINRIQNAIISLQAIQAGDPPKISFKPRETGEPPLTYLNTDLPEAQPLIPQVEAFAHAQGIGWVPTDPLPDASVQVIREQIALGEQMTAAAAQAGMPPPPGVIPPDVLVDVDDMAAAQAIQTIADALWEAEDCQYVFGENVLLKNVHGMQPTLFEWDDDRQVPILSNPLALHCFVDPTKMDPAKGQYAIYDEPLSADEAKARFPALAAEIDDAFKAGPLIPPGGRVYQTSARLTSNFYRDMGYVRHAWFRHQPYPMTPDEAVAAGRVNPQEVGTGELGAEPDPATGEMVPVEKTRTVLAHPQTGEELTPTVPGEDGKPRPHPQWPMRTGIRYIQIVANRAVADRECEFPDIPLPVNVNVLVPGSPYGQGEAYRLKPLQVALNYALSSVVTHQRYAALPAEVIDGEVAEQMGAELADVHTRPGQRIQVPPAIAARLGNDLSKVIQTIEPADMPTDAWKLIQLLVDLIDREGNQSDVMQGNAPAGWSGDAIASLQNAAVQVIKAKSMMTEFWLKRIGRLMGHAIVTRMPPEEKRRYLTGKPYHAVLALDGRAKSLKYDISVQINSGSGAARQQQTNSLIAARGQGVPISDPEILERLDIDPEADLAKATEYARKRAAFMPQDAAAAAGARPAANNGPSAKPAAGGRPQQPA